MKRVISYRPKLMEKNKRTETTYEIFSNENRRYNFFFFFIKRFVINKSFCNIRQNEHNARNCYLEKPQNQYFEQLEAISTFLTFFFSPMENVPSETYFMLHSPILCHLETFSRFNEYRYI